MTTRTQILVAFIFTLMLTPLCFGEVFAQSIGGTDVADELAAASSTEAIASTTTQTVAVTDWYKVERIFGNVEVGDFVVGPGRTEIELSPGQTVVREITVANRVADDKEYLLEIEDVEGSADGSSAVTLLGDKKGPYSVRDFISFPEDTVRLNLGERARIPITISVPPNTSPGGYYGSVLVSTVQTSPAEGEGVVPRSPIIARVGSLFFIRVKGEVDESGQTKSIDLIDDKMWYESGPVNMGILYENTGTVHLNPYGEISITNMFGEEVGFVELEPWFVLPKSLRVREIEWSREFLLGRYTVTARVNRGYNDIVDEVAVSFWVLPWKIVGGVFLTLFIIIFSVRAFFRTFEFKRKDA